MTSTPKPLHYSILGAKVANRPRSSRAVVVHDPIVVTVDIEKPRPRLHVIVTGVQVRLADLVFVHLAHALHEVVKLVAVSVAFCVEQHDVLWILMLQLYEAHVVECGFAVSTPRVIGHDKSASGDGRLWYYVSFVYVKRQSALLRVSWPTVCTPDGVLVGYSVAGHRVERNLSLHAVAGVHGEAVGAELLLDQLLQASRLWVVD